MAGSMPAEGPSLEDRIKARALELGFTDVGFAPVSASEHSALYEWWIEQGYHGQMGYLARPDARARRYDLRGTMESVRSAIVVTHEYGRHGPAGARDVDDFDDIGGAGD